MNRAVKYALMLLALQSGIASASTLACEPAPQAYEKNSFDHVLHALDHDCHLDMSQADFMFLFGAMHHLHHACQLPKDVAASNRHGLLRLSAELVVNFETLDSIHQQRTLTEHAEKNVTQALAARLGHETAEAMGCGTLGERFASRMADYLEQSARQSRYLASCLDTRAHAIQQCRCLLDIQRPHNPAIIGHDFSERYLEQSLSQSVSLTTLYRTTCISSMQNEIQARKQAAIADDGGFNFRSHEVSHASWGRIPGDITPGRDSGGDKGQQLRVKLIGAFNQQQQIISCSYGPTVHNDGSESHHSRNYWYSSPPDDIDAMLQLDELGALRWLGSTAISQCPDTSVQATALSNRIRDSHPHAPAGFKIAAAAPVRQGTPTSSPQRTAQPASSRPGIQPRASTAQPGLTALRRQHNQESHALRKSYQDKARNVRNLPNAKTLAEGFRMQYEADKRRMEQRHQEEIRALQR